MCPVISNLNPQKMKKTESLVKRGKMVKRPLSSKATLVNAAQKQPMGRTFNNARTYGSTGDDLLDAFFILPTMRLREGDDIIAVFRNAFKAEPDLAYKLIFWLRDVRGGAGERRVFAICYNWLTKRDPNGALKRMRYIPEYGRWDDLWRSIDDSLDREMLSFIRSNLDNRLLNKWLPRKGPLSTFFWVGLKFNSPRHYRKHLVEHTNVVEQQMSKNDWDLIEYPKVPSIALMKYRKAFFRHDEKRWKAYLAKAAKGEVKMNASVLYPHDIVSKISYSYYNMTRLKTTLSRDQAAAAWKNIPDFVGNHSFLPVVDVSGSMFTEVATGVNAYDVSVALGIYLSERNKSIFKDAFITFSAKPTMFHITKTHIVDKVREVSENGGTGYNTNLQKSMELIVNTAIENDLNDDDIPDTLLVVSDMEFDSTKQGATNLQSARVKFRMAGLKMPNIIFWNVKGRKDNFPTQVNSKGVGLISGFSPSIMKYLLEDGEINPRRIMENVLLSKRYESV